MPSNRCCRMCNKTIATDAVHCAGCATFYHPGCVRKRTMQTGTAFCCDNYRMEYLSNGAGPFVHSPPQRFSQSQHNLSHATPSLRMSTVNISSQPVTGARDISNTELIRLINERFDEISAHISCLPAMKACIESNTDRISALEERNRELGETLATLQKQFDKEQLERRKASVRQGAMELIISGVPCQMDSSLLPIVKDVGSALGVTLVDSDVTEVRFLVPRSRARKEETPLPILVKFRSSDTAQEVLAAKRTKGRLLISDLRLPTQIPSHQSGSVYINEALPGDVYRLLLAVKSLARTIGYKYVWHRDGVIFLRSSDGAKIERIHSLSQLRDFETRHNAARSSSASAANMQHSHTVSSVQSQAAPPLKSS